MVFTITQDGVSTTIEANDCPDLNYNHMYLGVATDKTANADTFGTACASYQFGQGDYIVDATVVLNGSLNEETSVVDTKTQDMSNSNNGYDFDVNFINYAPQILSLKSDLDSGIADVDQVSFTAVVFDIEGDEMTYEWADRDGVVLTTCVESICEVELRSNMVPTYRIVLTVSDEAGQSTFTELDISVANNLVESSSDLANDVQAVSYTHLTLPTICSV